MNRLDHKGRPGPACAVGVVSDEVLAQIILAAVECGWDVRGYGAHLLAALLSAPHELPLSVDLLFARGLDPAAEVPRPSGPPLRVHELLRQKMMRSSAARDAYERWCGAAVHGPRRGGAQTPR